MNLSLFLLLAPGQANESNPFTSGSPAGLVPAGNTLRKPRIHDPYRPGKKALVQASYHLPAVSRVRLPASQRLAFGVTVIANAVGFLALGSGVLLLLQIAQLGLE